jgi:hypothetical protein
LTKSLAHNAAVLPFMDIVDLSDNNSIHTATFSAYSNIVDTTDTGVVTTSVFIFLIWNPSFFILLMIWVNYFFASFLYFLKYVGGTAPKIPDESPYLIIDGTTDNKIISESSFIDILIAKSAALREYSDPSIGTKIFEKPLFILIKRLRTLNYFITIARDSFGVG